MLPAEGNGALLRQLLWLTWPVLVEHILHMLVGLTDTWLANHLQVQSQQAAATAAVGTIAYILWFIGLTISAIATGSMALIARAKGARHRSLSNSVCGQSSSAAIVLGLVLALLMFGLAQPLVWLTGLQGPAQGFALTYLRLLCLSLPFSTFMFVANACLRGAGDTLTPAITMVVVDVVNIFLSVALTYGLAGFPEMGFTGIAMGTVIAYTLGGLIQFSVLVSGRGGVRLHLHRMRPHWLTMKRVLRIGIPAGTEGMLAWVANFVIVVIINHLDPTNAMPAAHNNTIRIEAMSYMAGFAVATAAASMVGQSLGMKNPNRATRSAYLAYAVGGGLMTFCGLLFIFLSDVFAGWMSEDPRTTQLTSQCLFVAGFIQAGFAASSIFTGALRGAGDTFGAMVLNTSSIIFIRLLGVLIVVKLFNGGLVAIWIVLSFELVCRGALVYGRFLQGRWRHIHV